MDQVRTFWTQIGRQRLLMMGGVAAAMLVVLAMVALRGGDERMGFLYTDLDPSSAQGIAEKLKGQNIPFQLSADGTSVMAPESKLAELRMSMAGDKLGGKIGYEVLDQEEPFGVSASRAKLNETRAIEGELARSIQTLQTVSAARVHIVMPERAMFASSATKATAAVTVKTRSRLPAEAVQSIRYLVSSSVPELSPEAVSIVDQSGALLARAGDAATGGGSTADERQAQVEGRMRDEIEALLSPIVGQGKIRAEVSAEIDRDQTQEESDVYDPDKQVVGHVVTVAGKDQSNETNGPAPVASVATQLPDAQGKAGDNNGKTEAHDQTSEDTTYLNSKTHSIVTRGPGKIKRLTVAVMVDGGAKGLPAPQVQRLTRLVENAVGADTQRGDSVVIESMAFAADDTLKDDGPGLLSKLPMDMLAGFGKLVLIAAVGLIAMKMIRAPGADKAAAAAEAAALPGPEGEADGQTGETGDLPRLTGGAVTVDHVDGDLKIASLQRVGDAVDASPPEAAAVIRQWMNA